MKARRSSDGSKGTQRRSDGLQTKIEIVGEGTTKFRRKYRSQTKEQREIDTLDEGTTDFRQTSDEIESLDGVGIS